MKLEILKYFDFVVSYKEHTLYTEQIYIFISNDSK